jgi:hypothetical protein
MEDAAGRQLGILDFGFWMGREAAEKAHGQDLRPGAGQWPMINF